MTYPNVGMPQLDSQHRTYYSQTPEDMAALLDSGIFFLGGCCSTMPAHIRAFRQAMDAHTSPS